MLQKTFLLRNRGGRKGAMSENKIVVYTSIFGEYDGLLPQRRLKGIDYVCFTDHPLHAVPWEVRIMQPKVSDTNRCAKEFKILPHRFFPEYEYSIWIDGNYLVVGDIAKLVETALSGKNMACFDHNQTDGDVRNCIYKEFEYIMQSGHATGKYKDDPFVMQRQIERYKAEGYPVNNGLIFASILIRRHHASDVVSAMESWWSEISNGSRRDQLSFNYVAWKERFQFHVVEGNIRNNPWFYQIGIHRRSYLAKFLRYRLKRFFGLLRHR
jgi:hypothetical protein